MKIFLIVISALVLLFLLFTFGGGYYMYRFAILRRADKPKNYWKCALKKAEYFTDGEFAMVQSGERFLKSKEREVITIESHDGLKLRGHLVEHSEARGIVIMAHGYRSHPVLDFSCAVEPFYGYGFSMLLIDQRAHSDSEGSHIGFGALERYDIVRWTEYAKKRWSGLPVILDGVSMGAATIMMGAGVGYPDNVKALICDCGFTTPGDICRKVLKQWFHLPPFPLYYGAKVWVKLLAKFDLDGVSSAESLGQLKKQKNPPCILIAHGKKDGFVPYRMAEEIRAALEEDDGKVWFVASEEADHGMAFLKDREVYIAALEEMFAAAGVELRKERRDEAEDNDI